MNDKFYREEVLNHYDAYDMESIFDDVSDELMEKAFWRCKGIEMTFILKNYWRGYSFV